MTTTFFTSANQEYEPFVLPYVLSALHHNPEAVVEIVLERPRQFEIKSADALDILREYFPGRMLFRRGNFRNVAPNCVRMLETPTARTDHVYIGDIDILILEDVAARHVGEMRQTGLPYSNILRSKRTSLSGLHFTSYDALYPLLEMTDPALRHHDERLLFEMVKARGLALPDPAYKWRPIHGFHLSPSRAPLGKPGWDIGEEYLGAYLALRASERWAALTPFLPSAYRRFLCVLDAVLRMRFPEAPIPAERSAVLLA